MIEGEESKDIEIKRGVQQGWILRVSPTIFNIYLEAILAEPLEDLECVIRLMDILLIT